MATPLRYFFYRLIGLASLAVASAQAATPGELLKEYSAAAQGGPGGPGGQLGFTASAERGRSFFVRKFGVSATLESCSACHTDNPQSGGKHVVTGKAIAAMAPAANPERFTDNKKVDKWFRRNCTEVVGRECTPAEKADLIQFLLKGA